MEESQKIVNFSVSKKELMMLLSAFNEIKNGFGYLLENFEQQVGVKREAFGELLVTLFALPRPKAGEHVTVSMTRSELVLTHIALVQTLNGIDEWEFYTRTDVFREDFQQFIPKIEALIQSFDA